MSFDGQAFASPPGQCRIRIEDGADPLTLTNAPTADQLEDQATTDGTMGTLQTGPGLARIGSLSSSVMGCAGWAFLAFGVLFIGSMATAVFVFNQPFNFNGKPVGKEFAALFFAGFGAVWILGCAFFIYISRQMRSITGSLDPHFRLVLGSEEWVSYGATANQVIGRCSPGEIERFTRQASGQIAAHLLNGKQVLLTGPLPSLDSGWMCDALTRHFGHDVEEHETVHPYVPECDAIAVPGTTLAWRLNRSDSPWGSVVVVLIVCVVWNSIIGAFVYGAIWGKADSPWMMRLFLIPFVLVGAVLIFAVFAAIYHAIVQSKVGDTAVELEQFPLKVGTQSQAIILQHGPLQLRRLSIRLVCDEEAEYRQGTSTSTDTKRVRDLQVFEQLELRIERTEPLAQSFDLVVPADVMHSFKGVHNNIKWKLIVRGEPESWPAYEREFPVVIYPPAVQEAT